MPLYLPLAELSVDAAMLAFLAIAVGSLSGLFGIGGGFIMTPLLIFNGVPPLFAIGTETSRAVASGVTGSITHARRRTIDFKLAGFLILSGTVGSLIGVNLIRSLNNSGQLETVISVSYIVLLSSIGLFMFVESCRALVKSRNHISNITSRLRTPAWVQALPLKIIFHRSKRVMSAVPVIVIGMLVGFLAGFLGVGGGFLVVPALIYLLRVPAATVIGTSLFQILCVSSLTLLFQVMINQSVDVVLALILMIGSVLGTQIGLGLGRIITASYLRLLLALLILAVALQFASDLFLTPSNPFTLIYGAG